MIRFSCFVFRMIVQSLYATDADQFYLDPTFQLMEIIKC